MLTFNYKIDLSCNNKLFIIKLNLNFILKAKKNIKHMNELNSIGNT